VVGGLAYLLLSLLILGAIAIHYLSERNKALAAIDRRLDGIGEARPARQPRRPLAVISVPDRLAPLLAQAQVEPTAKTLRGIVLSILALAVVLLLISGPVVTLAMLVGLPILAHSWLTARARKRIDALAEAMPLYLDSVRQLQAVGNSLSQALERSLAESPEAIKSYFAPAALRLAMGAPVAETMQQLADKLQIPEVSMLAAAIRTNIRYGGSISGAFSNLAHILRERLRIKRELAAATSEAKMSSKVLIGMPLVAMAILMFMNPSYIDFFFVDERGQTMAAFALGLELLGILVIRRLLRLDF